MDSRTVTEHGIAVERTRETNDGELTVTLRVTAESDAAAIVGFEDTIPDDGVPVDVQTTGPAASGGHVEGTVTVGSGETGTVTYRVSTQSGDVPTDGGPRVVSVVTPETGESLHGKAALWWETPDGERVPLSGPGPNDGATPVVVSDSTLPNGPQSSNGSAATGTGPAGVVVGTDRPVIGIIARGADADGVYRTVLEARHRGFDVFVTPFDEGGEEVAETVGEVGVQVVRTDLDGDWQALRSRLSAAARAAGYPGIVLQPEGCPRIDYERTLSAFAEDGFEMYAVPERAGTTPGTPHVLVAIPAYNAARSIATVVSEAAEFANEVLVVDDGSTDGTADRARAAGATVVVHPRNRGYGGALKTVFEVAHQKGAAHVVTIDADGQHDAGDIPRLIATQDDSGAGVVIASRYGTGTEMPFVRSIGLGVVNLLTNVSMGRFRSRRRVRDTQSGFRAYTADAVETLVGADDIGDGMWASTDILYATSDAGFEFHEIGTTIRYDVENGSTEGAATHGFGLVHNIAGFFHRSHPILLVGVPGLMTLLTGSLLTAWSFREPASTPVVVVGTMAIALGVVMLTLSVLLHVLNTHPVFRQRSDR